MMSESRKQFERWAKSEGYLTERAALNRDWYDWGDTQGAWEAWEARDETITDLCNALDNVLHHTSTDTIAEAAAVLERARGQQCE